MGRAGPAQAPWPLQRKEAPHSEEGALQQEPVELCLPNGPGAGTSQLETSDLRVWGLEGSLDHSDHFSRCGSRSCSRLEVAVSGGWGPAQAVGRAGRGSRAHIELPLGLAPSTGQGRREPPAMTAMLGQALGSLLPALLLGLTGEF